MSHPSRVRLFRAWAKAMEQGATVGTPDYTKSLSRGRSRRGKTRRGPRGPRLMRLRRKRMD